MKAGAHAARLAGAHNSLASAFQMLAHAAHGEEAAGGGSANAALATARLPCLAVWGTGDKSHRKTDRHSTLRCLPQGTRMVRTLHIAHQIQPVLSTCACFRW